MEIVLYYAPTTCALVTYVTLTEAEADLGSTYKFRQRSAYVARVPHSKPKT